MTPEARKLLEAVLGMNKLLSLFVFALQEETALSAEEYQAVVFSLVDLAGAIQERSKQLHGNIHGDIVEGNVTDDRVASTDQPPPDATSGNDAPPGADRQ
jgi:hypothetical protein